MEKLEKVDSLVVHCSASRWGTVAEIRRWHKLRGFGDIGYHRVIYNGRLDASNTYHEAQDGIVKPGRSLSLQGAHCAAGGMNDRSIGICLIGLPQWRPYSVAQMRALYWTLKVFCEKYHLTAGRIFQHSQFDEAKPLCASLDIQAVRSQVAQLLQAEQAHE